MNLYEPNYQTTDRIGLSVIIFENDPANDDLTIEGFLYNTKENVYVPTTFSCGFEILTTILDSDYESCERLIVDISEKLVSEVNNELIEIDVTKLYQGRGLLVSDLEITYYRPFMQNEEGEWHEVPKNEEFYIIDKVVVPDKKENVELLILKKELDSQFVILGLAYSYFQRLIKSEYTQKQARKLAGLDNELLFRLATLNFYINNHEKGQRN